MAKFDPAQLARDALPDVITSLTREIGRGGVAGVQACEKLLKLSGYSPLDGQQNQVYEFQIVPIAFINEEITACPHLTPTVIYKATPRPQSFAPMPQEKKLNLSPAPNGSSSLPQDADGAKPIVSSSVQVSGVSTISDTNTPILLPPTP